MDTYTAEPTIDPIDPILIMVIVFAGVGIVLGIIYLAVCRKKVNADKRCSATTTGTVIGYSSSIRKGDSIWPSVLAYTVDGVDYQVTGPFFDWYVTKSVSTPFKDNDVQVSVEGKTLRVTYSLNSVVTAYTNPYEKLYPKGTQLTVYYNPADPADAFVERNAGAGQYRLIGIMALAFFAAAAACLVYFLFR
jgi:hypothetical protein